MQNTRFLRQTSFRVTDKTRLFRMTKRGLKSGMGENQVGTTPAVQPCYPAEGKEDRKEGHNQSSWEDGAAANRFYEQYPNGPVRVVPRMTVREASVVLEGLGWPIQSFSVRSLVFHKVCG